jgi:hypothetical protein
MAECAGRGAGEGKVASNASGRWDVTMEMAVGEQRMILLIDHAEDTFNGRVESAMGNFVVSGTVAGNRLRWEMKAKKPMPITVNFDVSIAGDIMSGIAKLGIFGKAKVRGERLSGEHAAPAPLDDEEAEVGPTTGESIDPIFNKPFIEVDEWRDAPVRHRYVRGGFEGTDARFSIYLPPAEQYGGRFFHNTYPLITNSDIGPFPIQFDVAVGDLGFTLDSGAYYLQTNLGGADRAPPADPAIAAYRVNAEAAKFSRRLASAMYGEHRAFGYLFGGSGGSYQVMGSAEKTQNVWDGFLPFVLGSPHAIPSMFTIRQHAMRVLRKRGKFTGIVDALEPGGSGDPYAGLDEEEAAALREATLMGFPIRAWWDHEAMTSGYYANVAPITPMLDPTYVEDFWSKPGYLGTDPKSSIANERFALDTEVAQVIEGFAKELVLTKVPEQDFANAHLLVMDGEMAGRSVPIASICGQRIGFAMAANHALIGSLKQGDRLRVDNSWALAMQTYHRHQVPAPEFYAWNQYRGSSGGPIYPQREVTIGLVGAANTAGCIPQGKVTGKVLVIECLLDIDALPWQADWYRGQVKSALGPTFDESFALWYIDNANHENPLTRRANAHIVSYSGALQQGLRDLAMWVETGRHPGNTAYEVFDSQVSVPPRALDRGGIQPTIDLRANGGARAVVKVGEGVSFTAAIEVPPAAGKIVSAEWDFAGAGIYSEKAHIGAPQERVSVSATHAFARPGTYFALIRVASHRKADQDTKFARVQNLARVRVVVV